MPANADDVPATQRDVITTLIIDFISSPGVIEYDFWLIYSDY
jgi:hypothetical protein